MARLPIIRMMNDTNNTQNAEMDEFETLLAESLGTDEPLKEGRIVKGHVVKVGNDFVIVDIGHKSEGEIAISQFYDTTGSVTVSVGQDVDVFLETLENEHGLVELSKDKADKMKVWDEISLACESDEIIEGTISQRVKGGLSVTIRGGIKAFLPGSQVDLRPIRNLERLIGETLRFKVMMIFLILKIMVFPKWNGLILIRIK
jgi:small subunit ribosomal protein S1